MTIAENDHTKLHRLRTGLQLHFSKFFCVNQVTFYSILELKQCPRCLVSLKSIQHLSLENDVPSSEKKHCNCLVKVHFYFKILCTTYGVQYTLRTHI